MSTLTDDAPDEWVLNDTETGEHYEVRGTLLGFATSQRSQHGHAPGKHPGPRACHACRWFEVRIIRTTDDDYVVSYQGFTTLPNEQHRHNVHRTASGYTVVEVLTQRRPDRVTGVLSTFIPRTSRFALADAAAKDEGIERAWVDRAYV